MKIVINTRHGGFGLSDAALHRYAEIKGITLYPELYDRDIARDDPILIQVVEELGIGANGKFAALKVVEIPNDVEWQIDEYDGVEWVAEKHRTWR